MQLGFHRHPSSRRTRRDPPSGSELWARLAANRKEVTICTAVAIVAGMLFSVPGNLLERAGFDLFTLLTPGTPSEEVAIILIDDDAYAAAGVYPPEIWPRTLHAKLLDYLQAQRPRLVAFDLEFRINKAPTNDTIFAAAIERFKTSNKAVCAVSFDTNGMTMAPILAAAFGETNLGHDRILGDSDQIVRRHAEGEHPTLAWVAAEKCGAPITKRGEDRTNKLRWIRYYGPRGAIQTISFTNAFQSDFRGKIVFIGSQLKPSRPADGKDTFATPFTRYGSGLNPGVEIHATIFHNLWRNEWIRDPGDIYYIILVLCGAFFGGATILLGSIRAKLLFTAISGVVVAGIALFAFWGLRTWVNWLPIVAVQLPVACATAVLFYAASKPDATGEGQAWPPPGLDLLKSIGTGGFGEVWLARNKVTSAYVAVKKIERRSFSHDGAGNFERELEGVRNFQLHCGDHRNWISVLHVAADEEQTFFYYTMPCADDLLTGPRIVEERYTPKTLKAVLGEDRWLPVGEAVALGIELAEGLAALHRCGYIHRDVKPSNILFVKNVPKLADIGLVVSTDRTISFCGTVDYMPPERQSSRLADIYALGVVLYEALTGARARQFPEFPKGFASRTDRKDVLLVKKVINRACEPEPGGRYQSAEEMRDDLARLKAELGKSALPI